MYMLNESSGRQLWARINFKSFKIITMVRKNTKPFVMSQFQMAGKNLFNVHKSCVHLEIAIHPETNLV